MEQIEYIVGNKTIFDNLTETSAWQPFDGRVLEFCDKLSKTLMGVKENRMYPDLVALAFWLRRSNLKKVRTAYDDLDGRLGVGLVFHIAPGNVALSFAYSMATGLLTGNTNIIRLPSRRFVQADVFCKILRKVLNDEQEIASRICLIKYPHDKSITDELSLKCHMRIIWGGNETINTIRQSPLSPRATEITFANRFSICIINANEYLGNYDAKKTAHDFYIDTFLSDQNACSSPRILFWMGERIDEAKRVFWDALYEENKAYEIAPITTVNKVLTFCKYASENNSKMTMEHDCRIMRIKVNNVSRSLLENIGNSGYFYECDIKELNEILPICTWELQTLSYIGMDEEKIKKFVMENAPEGIDRIVLVGRTMDFGFIWDGKDIVREMTRRVSMQ